ncbi:hypothetical protein BJV82DRAFT_197724 [Fennellomyces sp. T-0311]|nr:hypothetical protein BJV82DRAFT_197724 [Fennellomyces sp. T-0311]
MFTTGFFFLFVRLRMTEQTFRLASFSGTKRRKAEEKIKGRRKEKGKIAKEREKGRVTLVCVCIIGKGKLYTAGRRESPFESLAWVKISCRDRALCYKRHTFLCRIIANAQACRRTCDLPFRHLLPPLSGCKPDQSYHTHARVPGPCHFSDCLFLFVRHVA